MSTKDQLLYSALHGTAMRYAAERRNLDEAIEELRQIADGRNDILAEAAGITAGAWYASPEGLMLAMSWSAPGCSSSPEAAADSRWTMTNWRAGPESDTNGAWLRGVGNGKALLVIIGLDESTGALDWRTPLGQHRSINGGFPERTASSRCWPAKWWVLEGSPRGQRSRRS